MRLLNARTGQITEFISSDSIPPYAILSHTWGSDEVTYQEWLTLPMSEVEKKHGSKKISYSRRQAVVDGLDWVWVDTCCIDKTSSAELSEAINSMFRWYQNAVVCYTYLADISVTTAGRKTRSLQSSLEQSRWFTRGWTLQELLAPKDVTFYSQDWSLIGTKAQLSDVISAITRIDQMYLSGQDLRYASVSQRMSWASLRNTSRLEDTAYCLLGIFDVHMSLLYGEGSNAFRRLQEAIMTAHPEDHTLYAWGTLVDRTSWAEPIEKWKWGTPLPWKSSTERPEIMGLLARSPRDFKDSYRFVPTPLAAEFYLDYDAQLPASVGMGMIRLDLPIHPSRLSWIHSIDNPRVSQINNCKYAILLCESVENRGCVMALPLAQRGMTTYGRSWEIELWTDPIAGWTINQWCQSIRIGCLIPFAYQSGDIIFRRSEVSSKVATQSDDFYRFEDNRAIYWVSEGDILREVNIKPGTFCCLEFALTAQMRGFRICIGRVAAGSKRKWSITVGLELFIVDGDEVVHMDGLKWSPMDAYISEQERYFRRTLTVPRDEWVVDIKPLPRIFFRVERLPLDDGQDTFVEAIDWAVQRRNIQDASLSKDIQNGANGTPLRRSARHKKNSQVPAS